jgi:hypothetical protein
MTNSILSSSHSQPTPRRTEGIHQGGLCVLSPGRASRPLQAVPVPWRALAVMGLALCLLGACRPQAKFPGQLGDVVSTQAVSDRGEYADALKAWTRSGRIYRRFDTELEVTATYQSLAFRRAYTVAYAQAEQLDEEQKKALWERQVAEAGEFHEFLIASFVPDSVGSDLANPASAWKLYLEAEGGSRVTPEDVRRIRKVTPLITGFYPYVTPWAKVYKVRFPVRDPDSGAPLPGPGDQGLCLVITSPFGMTRLVWQPESGSPVPPPDDMGSARGGAQNGY